MVFFRNQDLQTDHHKVLAQKIGALSGKPSTSKLHVNPAKNAARAVAKSTDVADDEVGVISAELNRKLHPDQNVTGRGKAFASIGWHSE